MSLVNYQLTTDYLITAVLTITRPQKRTLPPRILEELKSLNSLDLYFKDQKLTPANTIAAKNYPLINRTLSAQLLHGIKKNSLETYNALRLWTGLLSMRTRSIRFASTKLVVGVVDELLILHCEPLNSTEDPGLIELTISELWTRFLDNSWLDVNGHQRCMMLKKIAEWSIKSPAIFWNAKTVEIYSNSIVDDQESVRSECLRQIKKLAFTLDLHSADMCLSWIPLLKVYAENERSSGSVNKRIAIEVLSHLCQSGASRREISQAWCEAIFRSSLASKEPPSTIACIFKLVWDEKAANLFAVLCELIMPGESSILLGKALALYKPNHAWEELICALSVYAMNEGQKDFVHGVLAALAHTIPDGKVYALIKTLLSEQSNLKFAAQLLHGINDKVSESLEDSYFEIVSKLIDLQVEEVGNVIESWTLKEFQGGGLALLENYHESLPFGLAGWVNGTTKFETAAKSRAILKEVYSEEIRSQFDELISVAENLDENFSGDAKEVEVLAWSLARVYVTLKDAYGDQIDLPTINCDSFQRFAAEHPSEKLEHWLQILQDMEALH